MTRIIAIIALREDEIIELKSPYPVIEMGPKIATRIPPPISNKSHIAKIKTKIEEPLRV